MKKIVIFLFLHACCFAGPDFLVIGAQKGGTTSIYNYLKSHPDIKMPKIKELNYFYKFFYKGVEWYESQFPSKGESFFLTGDVSPNYLYFPEASERAYSYNPDLKLIVLLRDPVSRAFSRYKNHYSSKKTKKSFEQHIEEELAFLAVRPDDSRVYDFHYLELGFYAEQLRRWLQYFPKEQILILLSEDFYQNTQQTMDRVYAFLGLEQFNHEKFPVAFKGSSMKMKPETLQFLTDFYRPLNEDLQRLLTDELGLDLQLNWSK